MLKPGRLMKQLKNLGGLDINKFISYKTLNKAKTYILVTGAGGLAACRGAGLALGVDNMLDARRKNLIY